MAEDRSEGAAPGRRPAMRSAPPIDPVTMPDADAAAQLAAALPRGLRFGTSSWTFPGWRDLVYGGRYDAKARTAQHLARYARYPLFRTVGIDSTYYRPADDAALDAMAEALPDGFRALMKCWAHVTTFHWSRAMDPQKRGGPNPDFLQPQPFLDAVHGPVAERFAHRLGVLLLEFPAIPEAKLPAPVFAAMLDRFLGALPRTLPLAVEIRTPAHLHPAYFAVLREHGVAHCLNHWSRMPPVGEQLNMPDVVTGDRLVSRLLLGQGQDYETQREAWAPFDRVVEPDLAMRTDVVRLARQAASLGMDCYVIVNNKAEGSAPLTVAALARLVAAAPGRSPADP